MINRNFNLTTQLFSRIKGGYQLLLALLLITILGEMAVSAIAQQRPTPLARQTPEIVALKAQPLRTGYEPPGAAAAQSLVISSTSATNAWLTTAEKTDYKETGRYEEVVALARKLEQKSPYVKVQSLGKSPQGRDLFMLIMSKERAFTPAAALRTGKPIVLLQSGIHAGEIGGKDATLMLLRDIVISKKYKSWLDKVIILALPIFNVDGHERFSAYNRINQNGPQEMGFRVTAKRYNLNRDYIKADALEMRHWLKMYNSWLPDLLIDNHVTDGLDHQYDLTVTMPTAPEVWPTVSRWSHEQLLPQLFADMERNGHVIGPYTNLLDENDLKKGVAAMEHTPRFSTGYAAVQNRAGLLIETHSLKSYRTQVWAHYDAMLNCLAQVAINPTVLRQAVREADQGVAKLAESFGETPLYLAGTINQSVSKPFTYKAVAAKTQPSQISGSNYLVYEPQPLDVPTQLFAEIETTLTAAVPSAYLLPPEWSDIAELLQLHGVKTMRLVKGISVFAESYQFSDVNWTPRSFEGRLRTNFKSRLITVNPSLPEGSYFVPLNNRTARIAMQILEPGAPDSALRWGFMNSIFEQKEYFSNYIMESIAARMATENPKLQAEFAEKLRTDEKFAADPQARLEFFYYRSPYAEADRNIYPIFRLGSSPASFRLMEVIIYLNNRLIKGLPLEEEFE